MKPVNAANWKVCEGCDALVARAKVFCPECQAYRFDEEPERVRREVAYRNLQRELREAGEMYPPPLSVLEFLATKKVI